MKFALALIASTAVAYEMQELEYSYDFMRWISKHNKVYSTVEEYTARFHRWLEVDAFIDENNHPDSGETHTAAHNNFSDWTEEEFQKMLTIKEEGLTRRQDTPQHVHIPSNATSVDWRTGACVNAVVDQGACGSCWAFAASASNESSYCIDGGPLLLLSNQQLVDCSTSFGNQGCNGGWYYYAWEYQEASGQELESAYPYTATDSSCKYNASQGRVKTVSGNPYTDVSGLLNASSAQMMSAIDIKPNAVAVRAGGLVFQTYSSGVITSTRCGTAVDHAITAVGYDSAATEPYFIVRNSWGGAWGDAGYVNIGMATGKGICGINQYVAYPHNISA